ncbi:hypothetical protein TGAMA5MH_00181 [Trichoderma gamsii]|uniref:Uncharacterized protein n=1 Tax=Trichoderma gamsii TaxID=398673 RepID=A0A2K0TT57_9HYPO|nr:hypothetical protein TGAMA5MH_00181 [Trichoderma gamsii]
MATTTMDANEPSMNRIVAEHIHQRAMSTIFLNEQPMKGPPRFREADLKDPRLRHCAFDPETIVFESRIGGGKDGYVWRVNFGGEGPFVLKVFWDQVPPIKAGDYYSMQRECQNAAVLQMMEAAVATKPVLVNARPETKQAAMENYLSFTEENCSPRHARDVTETDARRRTRLISSLPRMTKCYGWLKLPNEVWIDLPPHLQAENDDPRKIRTLFENHMGCVAVIYELVEEGENEMETVEDVDTFLWHAGFAYAVDPHPKNWKSGVLVDHSEIVHIRGYNWNMGHYVGRTAEQILEHEGNKS